MLRHLRIVVAIVLALLAWAFIALWIRSYFSADVAEGPLFSYRTGYHSTAGVIILSFVSDAFELHDPRADGWNAYSFSTERDRRWKAPTTWGFAIDRHITSGWWHVYVPHWFFVATSFTLAALFALKRNWRYSVRSILIATTIVAIAFGLGAYLL